MNATKAAIDTTVQNGEKWQQLTKRLIKKSEPIRKTQMNMVFDTATAVKGQVNSGKERMIDLVGYDNAFVEKAVKFAKKNPVSKKVRDVAEDIMEKVSENRVVKQVEKTTEDFKKKGSARFNEAKKDVLVRTKKILNKGEDMVEDALESEKSAKTSKAKTTAKAKKVAQTVTKKTTKVAKKAAPKVVKAKPVAKKVVAKKKTAPKPVVVKPAAKVVVADTKSAAAKKVAPVKNMAKVAVKDDLKIIYGVGPKLESVFNKNGIVSYADLAKADSTKIQNILEEAGPTFKNVDTSDWKKQAEVGATEGTEALEKWVARYRTA
ncbi:MAG: hypothetical protein WBG48_19805 [Pricia sp.]